MTDPTQPPSPPSYPPPPGYGPPPAASPVSPMPWDQREEIGFLNAFAETVKLLVTDPKGAFGRLRLDGDYVGPFLFALILGWAMAIVGQLWGLVFDPFGSLAGTDLLQQMEQMGFAAAPTFISVVIMAIIFPFIFVVVLFIGCALNHLFLFLVGALEGSEMGFEGTFKVACYAQVCALGNFVPLFGGFINLTVALVLLVIGFAVVHRTTFVRTAIAVLIPALLCCACLMVGAFAIAAALAAGMAGL